MEKRYMETLLSQIREKRAREPVRQEISNHIKDQKERYIADGMTEEEAEKQAVTDMGDPVETGMALDQIHRPKPAWGMLAVIAFLCAAGVILQYAVYAANKSSDMGAYYVQKQCIYSILGFFLLCGIYLIDYTRIAKYSRYLCFAILLFLFLIGSDLSSLIQLPFLYDNSLVRIFGHWISIHIFFYLYLPLYGAVLHSYRGCTMQNLWKVMLYTLLPIFFAFRLAHLSACINIFVIVAVMFCTAAAKGWFPLHVIHLPRAGALQGKKGIWLILPVFLALFMLIIKNQPLYQYHRLQAWLNPKAYRATAGYVENIIRDTISTSQLIGKNTNPSITDLLLHAETDYLLTYLIATFGILAAAALITLMILLSAKLLSVSIRQKNQLGMLMGLGCSLSFILQSAEYILVNLSLLPTSSLYLPLVSFGGSGMLQTCILLGMLLSIYRYENVVSEPVPAH